MSPINPAAPPPSKSEQAATVLHRTGVREWIVLFAFWMAALIVLYPPREAWIMAVAFLTGSAVTYIVRRVK